jgi:hypothetical protein
MKSQDELGFLKKMASPPKVRIPLPKVRTRRISDRLESKNTKDLRDRRPNPPPKVTTAKIHRQKKSIHRQK